MPTITIQCNGCANTMADYLPGKSAAHQDDLESLMTRKGIPLDAAEVDWNCGCAGVEGPRPSLSFPNYVPVEE